MRIPWKLHLQLKRLRKHCVLLVSNLIEEFLFYYNLILILIQMLVAFKKIILILLIINLVFASLGQSIDNVG